MSDWPPKLPTLREVLARACADGTGMPVFISNGIGIELNFDERGRLHAIIDARAAAAIVEWLVRVAPPPDDAEDEGAALARKHPYKPPTAEHGP